MTWFGKWVQHLSREPEELRAESLQKWAQSFEGVTPIGEIPEREPCRCAGVIQNIRIDPREGGSIEAEVFDGTGELVARWLGRQSVGGLRLGSGLILHGRVGSGRRGGRFVLNPDYELVPGPEHS